MASTRNRNTTTRRRKTTSNARKAPGSRAAVSTRAAKRTRTAQPTRRPGKPRASSAPKNVRKSPSQTNFRSPISAEHRVDIIGILLMAAGVILLLTMLTFVQDSGTGPQNLFVRLFGWGAYLLPIVLMGLGLWLLLSRMEQFPTVSTERLVGVVLLFSNLLAWFAVFSSSQAAPSNGGGIVGGFLAATFVNALGRPGTLIVLVAWLLIALVLMVDLSISDMASQLAETLRRWHSWWTSQLKAASLRRKEAAALKASLAALEVRESTKPAATVPSWTEQKEIQPPTETLNQPLPGEKTWILPNPEEILTPAREVPLDEESDLDRARVIEETLRSFSTPGHVVEIRRGPAVTLFGVEPDFVESRTGKTRVRVGNITKLGDDIALALKASRIRIQAPVPGKGYIGIEVPNQKTALVSMLELVESPTFLNNKSVMRFALGKDVSGSPCVADLASMPHLLIAGTTGSGKSVCVNSILTGYLLNLTPDQLRLVLVDPKRVELTGYNGIPHLLAPVFVDADKVLGALQWMLREMDLRYHTFAAANARNIVEYNAQMSKAGQKKMPYILVVIDELADLMLMAQAETEKSLTRLAQLARATGIHLILATQRPSTNIITGLIKANFPARIAFAVASNVDSRVILDQPGAERLLGKGDMLFQAPDAPASVRLQGTYVSDAEINRLTDFWRAQAVSDQAPERPDLAIYTPPDISSFTQSPLWHEGQAATDEDPIAKEALALIRKEGRASVTMLQRKLRIGYTRSARLIDRLAEQGIIGSPDPQTGVREVLDWGEYPPLNED